MRHRTHITLLASVFWLLPGILHAWADPGHRLIAQLARKHLEPLAQQHLTTLLGTRNLAKVSTWADEVMRSSDCGHTEPWHFINIEDGKDLESAERSPRGDLIRAIEHFDAVLRDEHRSRRERGWAARYLIHLVGDLHQPLHVGRRADRGGNDIPVRFFGESTNLHLVWDFHLVDRAALNERRLLKLIKNRPHEEIEAWRRSSYRDWLAESLEHRQAAYAIESPHLGRTYAERHLPLIELRLAQAGIRLAALFNEVLNRPLDDALDRPTFASESATTSPCGDLW